MIQRNARVVKGITGQKREKNACHEKFALAALPTLPGDAIIKRMQGKGAEAAVNTERNQMDRRQEEAGAPSMGQDSFSASVSGVTHRPWRMQQEEARNRAPRQEAAFAMVGRRTIEFADNGDGTLTAVRCIDRTADDLDIQFEAGACPVVAIAPKAFEGCSALRRVILPAALQRIGEMAFSGCAHIERIAIPGGVVRVGTLAFSKCQDLARVRIEPGVQALGPSCFSKCSQLVRVDIPASVNALGGGAFFGCSKQLTLYGAEGSYAQQYAKVNGLAFDSESWRQDEDMVLEENEDGTLVVLGARQERAVQLEIPSELCGRQIVAIAPKAFFANGTLERVSIGGGVRTVGDSAFFGCRSLVSLTFERGLEHVGDSAFAGCEGLSEVTLPWGTASVGRMAFFGCARLAFVKMPTTTRVSDFAFDGCAQGLRIFGGVNAGRVAMRQG